MCFSSQYLPHYKGYTSETSKHGSSPFSFPFIYEQCLNPGEDEIFSPSRPALGPTQPPVNWVPGLSRGKVRPGRAAEHSPPSSAAVMEE